MSKTAAPNLSLREGAIRGLRYALKQVPYDPLQTRGRWISASERGNKGTKVRAGAGAVRSSTNEGSLDLSLREGQ